jgi:DNA-3-methyladenine glycosylase
MFGPAGHAYVYFTYGMHHCLNVVTGPPRRASAVLIRALEPLAGVERMRRRRGVAEQRRLARGPGCVARALGLDRRHDGLDLTRGSLWVGRRSVQREGRRVARSKRVGIRLAVGRLWRWYLSGHPCVSGPGPAARRGPAARTSRRAQPGR